MWDGDFVWIYYFPLVTILCLIPFVIGGFYTWLSIKLLVQKNTPERSISYKALIIGVLVMLGSVITWCSLLFNF